MKPKRWLLLMAFMASGSCLTLLAVSWMPLWRVELPTGHLAEMRYGTFWQFLDNVPGAVEHLSTPQTPEIILSILPSVYFWENVGATVSVLILGAALGFAFWLVWQRATRRGACPPASPTAFRALST